MNHLKTGCLASLLMSLLMHPFCVFGKQPAKPVPVAHRLNMRQIADKCLPSVVMITVRGREGQVTKQGSGFVVGNHLIATNVHVTHDAHEVTVNFSNGRSVEALGVVNGDRSSDLILLYADTGSTPPLPLARLPAHIGDTVVSLGSPEGLSGSMSTGIISGIRALSGVKVLQTTAPVSHGSSGGPLLNEYGEVLGVTSFMLDDGQNLNFAYPSYFLKLLIPSYVSQYFPWSGENFVQVETTLGRKLTHDVLDYLPHRRLSKLSKGLDAPSFVKTIFESSGIKMPSGEESQARMGYDVPKYDWSLWALGDRLYFAFHHPSIDHTGIYMGEGFFAHVSPGQDHQIVLDRIDDTDNAEHLVCVRRSQELLGEPTQTKGRTQ